MGAALSPCQARLNSYECRYVCHLDQSSISGAALTSVAQQTVFATPLDRKLPRIRIHTRQAATLATQKFLVSIDNWTASSRYPEGHFVRALGEVESKEAEQESLLLEYEVPYRPFGKAILKCLPEEGETWKVPPKTPGSVAWRDREDLRDLLVCSIDPVGEAEASWCTWRHMLKIPHPQAAKISMTRCMPDSWRTAISRPAFVSRTPGRT